MTIAIYQRLQPLALRILRSNSTERMPTTLTPFRRRIAALNTDIVADSFRGNSPPPRRSFTIVHQSQGVFMNWFGQQSGEGFEYHLLVIAMSMALVIIGGGKRALDSAVARWLERGETAPDRLVKRAA